MSEQPSETSRIKEEAGKARRFADRLDEIQQDHPTLGFPIAVWRKFNDDQAGNLAALVAYWAFFSIFPLLLVAVTVIGFVGVGQGTFQDVLKQFPLVGNIAGLNGNWVALVIGIVSALWSGLAVVKAIQSAFDSVWEVPMAHRPNFFRKLANGFQALVVVGIGTLVSLGLAGLATGGSNLHIHWPFWVRVIDGAVTIVLNTVLLAVAYRWLTKRDLSFGDVLPGAVFAAVVLFGFELAAGALITHASTGQKGATGQVATVLGMLWFFALAATVVLYGAEINVVRVEALWPRALVGGPDTAADHRAYQAYAEERTYKPQERVSTSFQQTGRTKEPSTGGWRRRR
jgi:YihY family inner membrane protein